MKNNYLLVAAAALLFTAGCQTKSQTATNAGEDVAVTATTDSAKAADVKPIDIETIKIADAKTILARKQVPVLCYHQIRDWKPTDSKAAKDYIIPVATFKAHMKMLADSGYQTILPDQYYDYLNNGTELPA